MAQINVMNLPAVSIYNPQLKMWETNLQLNSFDFLIQLGIQPTHVQIKYVGFMTENATLMTEHFDLSQDLTYFTIRNTEGTTYSFMQKAPILDQIISIRAKFTTDLNNLIIEKAATRYTMKFDFNFFYGENANEPIILTGNQFNYIFSAAGITQPNPELFCPANGFTKTVLTTPSKSNGARNTTEDMILDEFRRIAADRLQCLPEQVRITTKVKNIHNYELEQFTEFKLSEIGDKRLTTCYIQRMNAVVGAENPTQDCQISIYDEFDNRSVTVYESQKGDKYPAATGFFADTIEISGDTVVQLIYYIAERLI